MMMMMAFVMMLMMMIAFVMMLMMMMIFFLGCSTQDMLFTWSCELHPDYQIVKCVAEGTRGTTWRDSS